MYYGEFFSMDESAFSIAPNPHYLYLSDKHREALAHLLYGVTRPGGFVLLTGDVGTGKTTLCRCLFANPPKNTDIAVIINPALSPAELLASICDELRVLYSRPVTIKACLDALYRHLVKTHAQGRSVVLIVDEAQNLSIDALEHIRVLTNLETDEQKLLQIVLVGQPQLREKLASPELAQLNQRVTARYHLYPLNTKEVQQYICHRLTIAGANPDLFTRANARCIEKITSGIPRLINVLCDRALLGAYVKKKRNISNSMIRKSAEEAFDLHHRRNWLGFIKTGAIAAGLIISILVVTVFVKEAIDKDVVIAKTVSYEVEQPTVTAAQPLVLEASVSEHAHPLVKSQSLAHIEASTSNESFELPYAEQQRRLAFRDLFALWGVDYRDIQQDPCNYAGEHALSCWKTQGVVQTIINLNRPAIVCNCAINYLPSYSVIRSVSGNELYLIEKGEQQKIDLSAMQRDWDGAVELLWKPLSAETILRPGMHGDAIEYLEKQVAQVFGRSSRSNMSILGFDAVLESEIKAFQRANRVQIDGLVGPVTQIHLNNLTQSDIPLLY